jgi:hypothetical protein
MAVRRENRRVSRLKLDHPLRVVMGSIGAHVRYDMQTRNVSSSGLFLDFEKPGRFPFTASSIMEVWVELEPGKTLFFNGKMARVVYPHDPMAAETGPGVGIHIVQIDKENEASLREFIERNTREVLQKTDNVA